MGPDENIAKRARGRGRAYVRAYANSQIRPVTPVTPQEVDNQTTERSRDAGVPPVASVTPPTRDTDVTPVTP